MSWNARRYSRHQKLVGPVIENDAWMQEEEEQEESAALKMRSGIIARALADLEAAGYVLAVQLRSCTALEAQLLAELVNWAAKAVDEKFYGYKPYFIRLALELGAEGGWGEHDAEPCFYLATLEGGVNCFHDPFGELEAILTQQQNSFGWRYAWSGICRQDQAYALVESYLGDGQLLQQMAITTSSNRLQEAA